MCGIVGILGDKDVAPLLVEGLKRLEYRGYDSAGIATLSNGHIARCRAQGKLKNLAAKLDDTPLSGTTGIGHTRWATHGPPTEDNAHPHATDKMAVVHNGIIENYASLKKELQAKGAVFETDTDTEVIAHLVTDFMTRGMSPLEASNATFQRLEGAYAVAMIFAGEHDLMIGARQGTPLAVGYGDGEMYLASDSYALAPLTQKITFLEDGDRVIIRRNDVHIYTTTEDRVERDIKITAQSGAQAGKGEYRHFMRKEIHEQPAVIGATLSSFMNLASEEIHIPDDILDALRTTPRLTMVACGTAFYTCMVAKYWFEQIAGLPCEIDVASEFRYREAPIPDGSLCLFVSQSGETLDTLEALRYCKSKGGKILSIVNAIESTIERESDLVLHTLAGPEISVASTKATTTQLTTLACLALALTADKQLAPETTIKEIGAALRGLPTQIAACLKNIDEPVKSIARDIADSDHMLYIGRGNLYPIALEGALKLKELSYIHAEGYAAGEFKHGPIALIDEHMPVAALAISNDPLFEKMASNIEETVARGGKILLISDKQGVQNLENHIKWSVALDDCHPFVAPILYTVPAQLLSYYIAVTKGTDVDQPRNLAKSVTVE